MARRRNWHCRSRSTNGQRGLGAIHPFLLCVSAVEIRRPSLAQRARRSRSKEQKDSFLRGLRVSARVRGFQALVAALTRWVFAFNFHCMVTKTQGKDAPFAKAAETHLLLPRRLYCKIPLAPWCRGAFALKFQCLTASFRLRPARAANLLG